MLVSVPLWLVDLSIQLPVIALVGRYPANKLIGRRPFSKRIAALPLRDHGVLVPLSRDYPPLRGRFQRVTHPFATDHVLLHDPFDLHVLCTPPALILSQDQTLHYISSGPHFSRPSRGRSGSFMRNLRARAVRSQ